MPFELTNGMARWRGHVDCTGVFEMLFLSSLADANCAGHYRDAGKYGQIYVLRGVRVSC